MKITLERLREIIIEEVIKEDEGPPPNVVEKWPTPLADETIGPAIGVLLSDKPADEAADIISQVFSYLYGSEGVEQMAEPEEEMRRAIRSPGQKKAEEVPVDAPEQKTIGGLHRGLEEIVQEEYYLCLIEQHMKRQPLNEVRGMSIESAEEILKNPGSHTREDVYDAKSTVKEFEAGAYQDPEQLRRAAMQDLSGIITNPMRRTTKDIQNLELMWRKFKGKTRDAMATIQKQNKEELSLLGALASFYKYLSTTGNIQQHDVS